MTSATVSLVLAGQYGLDPARLCEWRIRDAADARRRVLRLATASEYDRALESNGEEQLRLVEQLLVHESSFFRHPRSFKHLRESVRSARWTPSRSRPLRVLSAGCAHGEEPYSAAIALLEAGVEAEALRIEAVDISPPVLRRAKDGVFPARALRTVPSDVRQRWFEPAVSGEWRATEHVRQMVRFRTANILDPSDCDLGTHDVILCRNVLIYLASTARQQLAALLHQALAENGTLYSGQSEVLPLSQFGFVVEDRRALALRHATDPEPTPSNAGTRDRD